ncbi:uncharacterized membrane protein YidH (DUF202 family) [Rhodopseudomonas julia]|uniref:Uncharacterized membrane protein YidH (DUF202 family) n=1 Tax=Rhodopseudomonas julia TaxID=200617 RepID=A0ABU0C345_9BRAD|nr:DUF1206 domain-containing protein [Rhodopseudomonas julia]MDQ0324934.1 uncharacterized membrane protein YidH (DUF202 family) [Rhodopseudomonas julia]
MRLSEPASPSDVVEAKPRGATIAAEISQQLKWGTRGGYAARGVVYLVVGILAVLAAIGSTQAENTRGALREILTQPLGGVLLVVVGIGLAAFGLWRFAQSIGDLDDHGNDAKGLLLRFFLFCSGVIHMGLAAFVVSLLFAIDGGDGGSGDPTAGWLTWLFGQAWGRWVALGLCLVPVGIGLAHLYKGWCAGYEKYLDLDSDKMKMVKPVCSLGLIARGIIFIVIGVLAFYAGGIYDASSAPGLEDALSYIQGLPFGAVLLFLVALGLVAFAGYCFVEAAFRRIRMGSVTVSDPMPQ